MDYYNTLNIEPTATDEVIKSAFKKKAKRTHPDAGGDENDFKKIKSRSIFATHYHELIDLVNSLPQSKNLTVKTVNSNGNVQFLYELIEEGAGQSFGIHVAKLAGLPSEILNRSKQILKELESTEHTLNLPVVKNKTNQLTLFEEEVIIEEKEHPILEELRSMDVMNLTPLQALQKLDELKGTYLN